MDHVGQVLEFSLVGMGIVFLVLAALLAAISIVRRLDARWLAAEAVESEQSTTKTQNIDDTTLLLICAAVATIVGGRGRVRSIRRLASGAPVSAWSMQGRATLQGSHVIIRSDQGKS